MTQINKANKQEFANVFLCQKFLIGNIPKFSFTKICTIWYYVVERKLVLVRLTVSVIVSTSGQTM